LAQTNNNNQNVGCYAADVLYAGAPAGLIRDGNIFEFKDAHRVGDNI
jgi:hypothetical protein